MGIYEKSTANVMLNAERLKAFTVKSGINRDTQFVTAINIIHEVLVRKTGKKKKENSFKLERKKSNYFYLKIT